MLGVCVSRTARHSRMPERREVVAATHRQAGRHLLLTLQSPVTADWHLVRRALLKGAAQHG